MNGVVLVFLVLPEFPVKFEAVHLRHLDIGDDDVDLLAIDECEGLLTVLRQW